jgi:hypothetical protein
MCGFYKFKIHPQLAVVGFQAVATLKIQNPRLNEDLNIPRQMFTQPHSMHVQESVFIFS